MDIQNQSHAVETAQNEPERIDLDQYASYEEGESLVVCDRENANAWIKSDVTAELSD